MKSNTKLFNIIAFLLFSTLAFSQQEPWNTVETTTYAIDSAKTVTSKSKAYFDQLGKGVQTQSVDVKTGKIWVNQTLHDALGRPALSTLSAPVAGNEFQYQEEFVKNESSQTFDIADFETDPENPSKVSSDSSSKLGWYYSQQNTDAEHEGNSQQDITEYPYSRTIYSKLRPGMVKKVIGGNQQQGEWKNGYSFTMKAGQELAKEKAFNETKYNDYRIAKTVNRGIHGYETVVFTDSDGKTLAAARSGNEDHPTNPHNHTSTIGIGKQGHMDVHIPVGITGITITGAAAYEIFDLITEEKLENINPENLPNGFYRIAITDPENYTPDSTTITYKDNYYDFSLNEYNQTGQLLASYQPLNKLKSTFKYNALGQLTQIKSPDEGDAWFLYRKDGQIRFSINNKQWKNKEFSYTNYDQLGRPIESGVYKDFAAIFVNDNYQASAMVNNDTDPFKNSLTSIVDDLDGLEDLNCAEVQKTTYDYLEDTDNNGTPNALEQLLGAAQTPYYQTTFLAGNVAKTSNENTTTFYSYDIYGRVKWIIQNIKNLGVKTIDYKYDPITGAVVKVDFQRHQSDERFVHKYTYDQDNQQLTKAETSTNDVDFTTHATYEYYETGALRKTTLADGLQSMSYVYNLNGQLKAINHPEALEEANSQNFFGMQLNYYQGDYLRQGNLVTSPMEGKDQFNGNIKSIQWNNKALSEFNGGGTYKYKYNKNNWLTDADFTEYIDPNAATEEEITSAAVVENNESLDLKASKSISLLPGFHAKAGSRFKAKIVAASNHEPIYQPDDYKVSNITYDANGNIQTLHRNKDTENGEHQMDQFAYHYKEDKPNQLKQVTDQVTANTNAQDLKAQPTDNYIYNNIGQLIANTSENIAYVYNTSGLVTEVHKDSQPRVKFFYNDKGFRVRKEAYSTTGVLDKTEYYVRDASGNTLAIYKGNAQTELPIYGAGNRLGVHYKETNKNVYQLADHLGNVRAVIARDPTTGDAMALTATDYYPFGMTMPGRQVAGGEKYRYAFQGQEKDEETGMEAFELRLWDSRIGRWLTTDPASQFSSPYLGMGNNPIIGIDPDGAWVKGAGFFRNIFQSDGRILANDFISSNGSGSLTRYKNLFVVDYNNASSNQAFNIYKRNGNFTGTLEVTGYQPTANGLEIQLGFDEIVRNESKFSDYRWVQSIRTDVPLGGATSPYNDPQPGDDNLPFYWTNAELPGYSNIGNNELTFYDKPGRRNNADWNAELSLVGKRNVKYRNLGTINYGFNLLNGRVSIKNIVFSTATKFHRKTFN